MATKKRSKYSPAKENIEFSPYLAKAGEHFVLAKLLLLKFDAALVEVDAGTDILAEKKGRLFRFQVKTRTVNTKGRCGFALSKKALARKLQPQCYIFITYKADGNTDYFIFPKAEIKKLIKNKTFLYKKTADEYLLNFIYRDDRWYIGTLKHEGARYRNAWHLIK